MALGSLVPIVPKYAADELYDGDNGEAALFVAVSIGAKALMQFIFSPMFGSLADHFGRRKILILSLIVSFSCKRY